MRVIVWMLSELLKTALRIEHKLDILLTDRRPLENGFLVTPRMQNQNVDPVTGQPVKYVPVQIPEHGLEVMVRESSDGPVTTEPPKSVGG